LSRNQRNNFLIFYKIYFFREELDQWVKEKKRISKKEILNEADNLKIGSHGGE
jgi:hypothetical protein